MKTNTFMTRTGEAYSSPEINVMVFAVEHGVATSFPGGDVNPLSSDENEGEGIF